VSCGPSTCRGSGRGSGRSPTYTTTSGNEESSFPRSSASLVTTICAAPGRADHHVRVDDVARTTGSQQETGGSGRRPIERHEGQCLPAESVGQGGLALQACGSPGRRSWPERYAQTALGRTSEGRQNATVVTFERDQAAGVKRGAAHAAVIRLVLPLRGGVERTPSAHARSCFINGPPVCANASASMSRHPFLSLRCYHR
jgi:hypothetical protein